ncbi:MAG TPA: YncE family protein [Chitinophagales bacterium]|nr:YncE family protein [Chitinophagales bacterium]
MKKIIIIIFILLIAIKGLLQAQTTKSQYKIVNTFHIDGDDWWDYLTMDEATERLFISHGTQVQVLDVNKGKVIGTIPDTKGVHGIALAPDLNKGFTSNGSDSSVTVFNLTTLAVSKKIKVTGTGPDAILYDPFTHRVFTFNGRSSNVTVIDANKNKVIGTIPLDGKPEFAVTDGQGKLFVNIEDKIEVSLINPSTMKVEQTWSLGLCESPSGMAMDKVNHLLFIVCDNKLMTIMNSQTGKVIRRLPIGEHPDGCAFDPVLMRAYSSNGDGTLTVVQEEAANKFSVLENITTQKGARTITLDLKTHHLYLSAAEYLPAPAPTTDNPNPRPAIKPDTFVVIEIEPVN